MKTTRNPNSSMHVKKFSKQKTLLLKNILNNIFSGLDRNNNDDLINNLFSLLGSRIENPIHLHGHRIEHMFGYVLRGLDSCSFIKQEDTGRAYTQANVSIPDYRIITKNSEEFYVEVKNYSVSEKYPDVKFVK